MRALTLSVLTLFLRNLSSSGTCAHSNTHRASVDKEELKAEGGVEGGSMHPRAATMLSRSRQTLHVAVGVITLIARVDPALSMRYTKVEA